MKIADKQPRKKHNLIVVFASLAAVAAMAVLGSVLSGRKADTVKTDDAARLIEDAGLIDPDPALMKTGPVRSPWIALRKEMESTVWRFLASSEEEKVTAESLAGMKTLILCEGNVGDWGDYSSFGSSSTKRKKSEAVRFTYIDLESGARVGTGDVLKARALPKTTSNTGSLVYSDAEVKGVVRHRVDSGVCSGTYREDWETDDSGAVTAWTAWRAENVTPDRKTADYRVLAVPEGTEKIRSAGPDPAAADLKARSARDEALLKPRALYIPASVTEIADGALDDFWFVIVSPGSWAESWARENGVPYVPDGSGAILVPENTKPDRLAFLQDDRYENPMAALAERLKITRMEIPAACGFPDSGLPGRCGLLFVVERDSPAEAGLLKAAEYSRRDAPFVWPGNEAGEGILSLRPRDTLVLGSYEQDGNEENGKEPVHWTVLTVRGDRALLLSALVLDMHAWQDTDQPADWKESRMREWLNGEFADAVFSEEEKASLSPAELGKNYKIIPREDGSERLFLLSEDEYESYGVAKYIAPSAYAVSRGAKRDEKNEGHCDWLFRNTDNFYRLDVNIGGYGNPAGRTKPYGVLPAVWVSMRGSALIAENTPRADDNPLSWKERLAARAQNLAPGDAVFFGRWSQEGIPGGQEEIEWTVLEVRDGRALLLSRYVLDARPQQEDRYAYTSWDGSLLRSWLNTVFFNKAFTGEQRAAVCVSRVSNKAEEISESAYYSDPDTVDRVFLLSWKDAFVRYFPAAADRRASPVPAAACAGLNTAEGCCGWWIRSNESGDSFYAVGGSGDLQRVGATSKYGVRPALWLDLSVFAEKPEEEKH